MNAAEGSLGGVKGVRMLFAACAVSAAMWAGIIAGGTAIVDGTDVEACVADLDAPRAFYDCVNRPRGSVALP